jgi:hypothetical protein
MILGSPIVAIIGLVAALAPILIHLLWRRRRTPVPWAAIKFVIEAIRRTRRRRRIEHILIIVARTLIPLLAAFALARPHGSSPATEDASSARRVFIIIDDGLCAALAAEGFTALERHSATAREIIEHLRPSDRVALIAASDPPGNAAIELTLDHAALTQRLQALEPSYRSADIPAALDVARDAVLNGNNDLNGPAFVYLLSEFRDGSTLRPIDIDAFPGDNPGAPALFAAPPALESIGNVTIAAVDPIRRVRLRRDATAPEQASVRLLRSGSELPAATTELIVTVAGGSRSFSHTISWVEGQTALSAPIQLPAPPDAAGPIAFSVMLSDDANNLDNQYFGLLDVRDALRVMIADRRPLTSLTGGAAALTSRAWIAGALRPTDHMSAVELAERDPAALTDDALNDTDVMFMIRPDLLDANGWPVVRTFVDKGGVIVMTPPADQDHHDWLDQCLDTFGLELDIRRAAVDHEPPLFISDDQPNTALLSLIAGELPELTRSITINRILPVQSWGDRVESILTLSDDSVLAIAAAPADAPRSAGFVVLFAAPMDPAWTNLPTRPFIVPLLHELVRNGVDRVHAQRGLVIGDPAIPESAPGVRTMLAADEPTAARALAPGAYERFSGNSAPAGAGAFTVNIDPRAARTRAQSTDAVRSWLAPSGRWEQFDADDPARALMATDDEAGWVIPLLLIALAILLMETALARRFSRAERPDRPGADDGLRSTVLDRSRAASVGGGGS